MLVVGEKRQKVEGASLKDGEIGAAGKPRVAEVVLKSRVAD